MIETKEHSNGKITGGMNLASEFSRLLMGDSAIGEGNDGIEYDMSSARDSPPAVQILSMFASSAYECMYINHIQKESSPAVH